MKTNTHNSKNTYKTQYLFWKKNAFTIVDVNLLITVQSWRGAKHRVKIVKIEGKYSTVRDKEQEAAKSGWNAAFHYHSTKEFIKN